MADILTLLLQAWLEKASRWVSGLRILNKSREITTILRLAQPYSMTIYFSQMYSMTFRF